MFKKLSIIIPVYQVEQYIRPCLESVFMQGMDDGDFEVILVDDGTVDQSFARIADIVAQHPNITIHRQSNQGLSVARNGGLQKATGEYVLFVDSDDLLVPHSLPPLLADACAQKPDVLYADFVKLSDEQIAARSLPPLGGLKGGSLPGQRVSPLWGDGRGASLFVHHFNPRECFVWRALYRRQFLVDRQLRFIPGIYFEDVPFTVECYLKADKCIRSTQTLYIYRQRSGSICATIDCEKIRHFNTVIAKLWEFKETMTLAPAVEQKLMDTIFAVFSVEVWHIAHSSDLLAEHKSILADLKQRVPQLRFTHGPKQRLVSWAYRHTPSLYIRLKAL